MELKVGSRIKCLKTSAEFMVVKLGDGTLTNSGQKDFLADCVKTHLFLTFV